MQSLSGKVLSLYVAPNLDLPWYVFSCSVGVIGVLVRMLA